MLPILKYLYVSNLDFKSAVGYNQKIIGQAIGLASQQNSCDLIFFDIDGSVMLESVTTEGLVIKLKQLKRGSKNLIIRRKRLLESTLDRIKEKDINCVYFRYPKCDPLYIFFLWRIRQLFPKMILLCEFPTFPYDHERGSDKSLKALIIHILDRFTRVYLKYFITKAIAVNYSKNIFGMSTISIDNGIKVSEIPLINCRPTKEDNVLNLIGVANVKDWHGYDRVLNGLKDYYQQESPRKYIVNFHIVGAQDPYLKILQSIVSDCAIQKYVIFHVPCQGEKLDSLFNISHLAIGVLGGHRKGLNVMSPLKHREYCARGIPFILSHQDPDFPLNSEYCLHFPHDDTPIKIGILIDFYLDKYKKYNSLSTDMRLYAKQNLDWSIKLKPVKLYVESSLTQTLC